MNIREKKWVWMVFALVAIGVMGCGPSSCACASKRTDSSANTDNTQVANPASEKCLEEGGELNMLEEEGGQMGVCVFDDGSRCEEWSLMRGQCEKGKCTDEKGLCE